MICLSTLQERELQVHLPIIGKNSQSVLMSIDFEICLSEDNCKLYSDKETQREYFSQTIPVIDVIKRIFTDGGMPFLLDYAPSGGDILFHNPLNHRYSAELNKIGYMENDVIKVCNQKIPDNPRRHNCTFLEAASVFSILTKIAEHISLLAMKEF